MNRRWWVTGVVPCPGVALPSSLACERTGRMGGDRGHRAGRRLGTCPAGSAQSGFVVAGWHSTGHSACPSTSSVCTSTGALGDKEQPEAEPPVPPAHPTDPTGLGQGRFDGVWIFLGDA